MPPRNPVPVVYPRLSFAACGSPEKTGVSVELAALIRAKLAEIGCEDLLSYNPPMTYLDAVTFLGAEWENGEPFGEDYLFLDRAGCKVRCTKNVRNRPLGMSSVEPRVQDILNGRWELNGETGVIGRDATVLDFQHTCVALILAWQDWELETDNTGRRVWERQWPKDRYPDGPTIEKCVVYGIENVDRVVNTINTGRPRSLSDVLYRCPYFASLPKRSADHCDRTTAAKVAADAIRVVWHRTGMYLTNLGATMTHAEACAWVDNHGGVKSRLLEAVRHVLECNKTGNVTRYVKLGYAAAMCWLMGQSTTEETRVGKYYAADPRTGKTLQWDRWERAKEFWLDIAEEGTLLPLIEVLNAENTYAENPENGTRARQKDYAIVSAWRTYRVGQPVDEKCCKVRYTKPRDGSAPQLSWTAEERSVGGVDLGNDRLAADPEDDIVGTENEGDKPSGADRQLRKRAQDLPITHAAAYGTTDLLALIRTEHPEFGCVLMTTPSGGFAAWDDEISVVQPYVTKQSKIHPKGIHVIVFRADEVDVLIEHLTGAGITVGIVRECVGAGEGEARYVVENMFKGGVL